MVRSIGVDPGEHTVKVVELDGSYRKTRLLRIHTAPVLAGDAAARAAGVAAAAEAARGEGMRGEICLGHPCREAVLRNIELPFKGRDAIRKVIKAEIEGEIHSHVVDEMVVDFHEIGPGAEGGTKVLVASVPKQGLRAQLGALSASGLEAEAVDLDTMALWRAAHWAGVFSDDEEAAEGEALRPKALTAVVDLGSRSTRILLVEGDRLVDMRALRLGDGAVADEIARRHGLDLGRAHEAVRACQTSGRDQAIDVEEALPADAAAPADAAPATVTRRRVTVECSEVEAAQTAFLQRLARELTRYFAAAARGAGVRAAWITGGASQGPGVKETLAEVFGVEPQVLDLLATIQHDLEPELAAEVGPRLTVAIGLALRRLGGPEGFQLRQEDLVLARGFERVKFPLAIACLSAWLALFVYGNTIAVELRNLELQIGSTYRNRERPKDPPLFHGMLNSVFRTKWFEDKQNFSEKVKGKDFTYKDLVAELDTKPVADRLRIVRDHLKAVADQKQKDSGVYEDVSLESGLAVLVRFSEILDSVHEQLGRYLIPKLDLNMRAPNRRLEFHVAFRGDDFRGRLNTLQQAIEAEYAKPDSPFERPAAGRQGSTEERFRDENESGVQGAYYKITLTVKDAFEPFGGGR